jgi:hypothetical protein
MTTVRSLRNPQDSATVSERVLLSVTASPSADPAVTENGWSLNGADFMHLYCDLDGATSLAVTPWYFNNFSGLWYEDAANQVTFTATQSVFLIEVRGEEKVFLVADTLVGSPTTAVRVFGGYSYSDADVR